MSGIYPTVDGDVKRNDVLLTMAKDFLDVRECREKGRLHQLDTLLQPVLHQHRHSLRSEVPTHVAILLKSARHSRHKAVDDLPYSEF